MNCCQQMRKYHANKASLGPIFISYFWPPFLPPRGQQKQPDSGPRSNDPKSELETAGIGANVPVIQTHDKSPVQSHEENESAIALSLALWLRIYYLCL